MEELWWELLRWGKMLFISEIMNTEEGDWKCIKSKKNNI